MRCPIAIVLFAAAILAPAAHAEAVASVASPDGALKVELDLNGEGRLAYRVSRKGQPLVADSRLGFILRNDRQFLRGLKLDAQSARSFDETWEQPWGERRFVRNHYNELRASFVEGDRDHRRLDVVFRVFDDGVGFRYEFPKQPKLGEVQIEEELTEFAIARPATAWWIPAYEWNREEYLYNRTPLAEVGVAQTPITLRTADGTHLSIHEAALVDYAGMNLAKGGDGRLRASLTPGSPAKVVRHAPFATPWRTILISDRAGGLVESSLILNLNEPNRFGDVGWFKPSKYVGVWWSLHLDKETWATGPKHGATTANAKRYIDFAAANGFRGVLVEGWNVGYANDGQDMEAVGMQATLESLHARNAIRPIIVVAIDMPPDRMAGYGLFDRAKGDPIVAPTKYGAVGANAQAYAQWLTDTVVPVVDARYRTVARADGRAILGWSLGALSAFGVGWQYPELFGRVGAFSPSFWLSADNKDANAVQSTRIAHALVDASAPMPRPELFFAIGTKEETDDRDGDGIIDVLDDTRDLIEGWTARDGTPRKGLRQLGHGANLDRARKPERGNAALFSLEGGRHDQASWARMLPVFLRWAYAEHAGNTR